MKKSLTRILSLVLVVVMMLGVMPLALAVDPQNVTATISGAPSEAVNVGDTVRLTVSRPTEATEDYTNTSGWSWKVDGTAQSSSSSSLSITVTEAMSGKTVTATVSGTYTSSDETKAVLNVSGSASFSVAAAEEPAPTYTITVAPTSLELAPGDSDELTATVKDGAGEAVTDADISWETSASAVAVVTDGVVTAREDATAGQTATITASYTPAGEGATAITATCSVTIQEAESIYAVTISPATASIPAGSDKQLTASVLNKETNKTVTNAEVEWDVTPGTDSDGISVTNEGKVIVESDAKGTATVTATYTPEEGEPVTGSCAVTVTAGEITCDNYSVAYSSTASSYTLKPKYAGESDSVQWRYQKVSGESSSTVNNTTGVVSVTAADVIGVKISAYEKNINIAAGTEPLATKTVYVSFYPVNSTITVTMKDDLKILDFDDKSDLVNSNKSLAALMKTNMLVANEGRDWYNFRLSDPNYTIGKLEGFELGSRRVIAASLGNMTFSITGGAGGQWSFDYTVTMGKSGMANDDVILGKGGVLIKFEAEGNVISYETDNKTKVTFSESDFNKIWAASGHDEKLSYVMFGTGTYVPEYGKLFTSKTNTTDSYKVKNTQKFGYGSYTNTSWYDLGSVTYVPDVEVTKATYVTIPYTAYGTGSDTLSGTVEIKLNQLTNEITTRGTTFGTASSTDVDYADMIAEYYKEKSNGANLNYVIFDLPSAQKGSLYKSIPVTNAGNKSVAQAELLQRDTELYYTTTGSQQKLYAAAFVPAAGVTGKVTLTYTAYGDHTTDPKIEGSITFNVVGKKVSGVFTDVTSKYSWAADSTDFLYYEGTAQGSSPAGSNKVYYNPANNITRGDFMLMLYRAFLADDYGSYYVTSNFPDVVKGTSQYSQETYQAVGVAKMLGIAQGTNDKFNPKANITRQEAMVLIYRTLDTIDKDLRYTSSTKASSFKDYKNIGSWAVEAITNLVSHGVIQGSNEKINPQTNITRAEMACILHRVITY